MLKILTELWPQNKDKLRDALSKVNQDDLNYNVLVKLTFQHIYNTDDDYEYGARPYNIDINNIIEIDHGNYQGTLLYLLPFDTYQPSHYQYLMTYVDYGSCSVCDTLQSIINWDEEPPSEQQLDDLMTLCCHILEHTICPYYNSPYNDYKEEFKEVKV